MAKNCRGFLKVCTNGRKEGGEKLLYEQSTTTPKKQPHKDNRISPVNKYTIQYDAHARISANKPPDNVTVSNIVIKKLSKIESALIFAVLMLWVGFKKTL